MNDMLWCAVVFSNALSMQAYHSTLDPRSAFAYEAAMYWAEEAADLVDMLRACKFNEKAGEIEILARMYTRMVRDIETLNRGLPPDTHY